MSFNHGRDARATADACATADVCFTHGRDARATTGACATADVCGHWF